MPRTAPLRATRAWVALLALGVALTWLVAITWLLALERGAQAAVAAGCPGEQPLLLLPAPHPQIPPCARGECPLPHFWEATAGGTESVTAPPAAPGPPPAAPAPPPAVPGVVEVPASPVMGALILLVLMLFLG